MVIPGNRSLPRWVRGCECPPRRATNDRSKLNFSTSQSSDDVDPEPVDVDLDPTHSQLSPSQFCSLDLFPLMTESRGFPDNSTISARYRHRPHCWRTVTSYVKALGWFTVSHFSRTTSRKWESHSRFCLPTLRTNRVCKYHISILFYPKLPIKHGWKSPIRWFSNL